ncbi:MAG TPA: hypothetical protein VG329_00795 [Candidatus Dormibacteraeota bacterium]|jgi:hypothetical protein|nr:hypothetical protein [Candidatus Dormibacteraeota bacterium]
MIGAPSVPAAAASEHARLRSSWRRELLVAAALGTALFAVTMVPYLVAYLNAPPGGVFNGFFFLGDDGSTYISEMRAGANGAWGWIDPYISRPVGDPVLLFMLYILAGKLAALAHIPVFAAFHLLRLSGAVALVLAARRLAVATLPPGRPRQLAVILGLLGAGAGYLLALASMGLHQADVLGQPLAELDLHIPEISGFFSVMTFPHFAWAAALMALAVVDLMAVASAQSPRAGLAPALRATIFIAALVFIHPQMLVILAVLATVMLLAFRPAPRQWVLVLLPFLLCAPLFLYFLYILTTDPVVSVFARQWTQGPFPVLPTLFAFGFPLVLAAIAIATRDARRNPRLLVLAAWVAMVLALLYLPSPVSIQRRLFDGIFLPIGVLAAVGVEAVARRGLAAIPAQRLGNYIVAACLLTSGLVYAVSVSMSVSRFPGIYINASEAQAMDWLAQRLGPGTPPAVMSVTGTGLFIPALAGARVYTGNYSQTIDSASKADTAATAIRAGGPGLVGLMRDQGTTYLFIGPEERASGVGSIDLALSLVYDQGGVQIYRLDGA